MESVSERILIDAIRNMIVDIVCESVCESTPYEVNDYFAFVNAFRLKCAEIDICDISEMFI